MIIKGRGKFVGSITSKGDGPTLIRIENTKDDSFWLEIELNQAERDALQPFTCPHCGPDHCDLRPHKGT